ncbi:MAG: hypothetical protein ACXVYI_05935 [Mycobacterium sp.]
MTTDSPDAEVGDASTGEPARTGMPRIPTRVARWCSSHWRALVLATLVALAVGVAASVYFLNHRPDQQTDQAAQQAAEDAATEGAVAVLSYSPESLDQDIAKAKSHLTGEFLSYYTNFTQQVMASAARDQQITTTANVVQAAVEDMKPDSAVVLVFVNKYSASKAQPAPVPSPATVKVTLRKVDSSWLISEFEPL